ncbi:uncharacterized protein LOC113066585 [Carassius auratus]|uniref:Uncharacterized protein LOC113066585 n=1 Tax=Carassius auratus TaxID=7957 RepID=A0A6P6MEC5_CARAU|nr:uncharacterized protein LOC113066585 [Carassius auratus]
MSNTSENTLLATKEVSYTTPTAQDVDNAEQVIPSEQADITEQVEVAAQVQQPQVDIDNTQLSDIRRSQRARTLTEKGKTLQDARLNDLRRSFEQKYRRWKYHINGLKRAIKNNDDAELICEVVSTINATQSEVDHIYGDIRSITSPEPEIRRKNDTCLAITSTANEKSQRFLNGDPKDIPWPDSDSVFEATVSSIISATSSKSKSVSKMSSQSYSDSLQKRQEAAAEVAATQEVIKIMKTQHQHEEEIRKLEAEDERLAAEREAQERETEAENARKRAQFISESTVRKIKLEEKKKEVERLEELKRHNAAQARLQVYAESIKGDEGEQRSAPLLQQRQEHYVFQPSVPFSLSQPFTLAQDTAPFNQPSCSSQRLPQAHISQSPTWPAPNEASNDLVKALAEAITANRIPITEPVVFSGDPLKYNDWKLSFQTLIDRKNLPSQEKLFFLRKYVGGPAKRAIEGHFVAGTEMAYTAAWNILDDRFGNPFVVGKSYRDKIQSWHKIAAKDSKDLQEFVDFLSSVESAMPYVQGLQALNDCVENQRILAKLPDWLSSRWNRAVTKFQDEYKGFPDFKYFVEFLNKEARIACNPITSLQAIKPAEQERFKQSDQDHYKFQRNRNSSAKTFTTSSSERTSLMCVFCKRLGHTLHKCRKFMERPIEERLKFVQSEKLCFGCLKTGHNSRSCTSRSVCEKCEKCHPTSLHQDRVNKYPGQSSRTSQDQFKVNHGSADRTAEAQKVQESKPVTSNRVVQERNGTHTSSIIPVYVSTTDEPRKEILVYALLDTQSDTTFILKDTAETLDIKKEPVKLKISTITSKTKVVSSHKLNGLQVRGIQSEVKIKLPTTYTRDYIPANRSHIPTCETAKNWPHLEHLADEMAPALDCEVGLLIGYNCPQALLPRDVLSGNEDQPFAQRSVLGWSIVGYNHDDSYYEDEIGVSHRIIMKQVLPARDPSHKLKSEVCFVQRNKVKEMITPAEILKVFESDFVERDNEEVSTSQEDLRFLAKLNEGIKQVQDGHYEMPLPFKGERPDLPNNKACAEHRLKSLEKRLKRDEQYQKDYMAFMKDIIARGDAERVPEMELSSQPAWYIPHHGVYNPQKPGKIRIVFDCSARFQNTSLNEHLLTGPDLTNTLVGVLCRFRKGQVAIMCDVERMFHQFHVAPKDRDYLRFLWWEDGNMEASPSVFRMKVHLFGAASSPGCANFGLKYLAVQGQGKFNQATVKFIQRNFYVDDGLASVDTEAEAIQLVKEARGLCNTGKLRLHKFITNSKTVIATIPKEECTEGATDFDLTLGEPKVERALGIQWCVASDKFHFRVLVKENPFTRRGVLSTVASIFDPLGFVAPFILVGKRTLQKMCQDKLGWDEPLPDDFKPHWEAWLRDLHNLSLVKIPRCYVPSTFKDVQQYELHHFSDASVSGYGVCSYLRVVTKSGEVYCTLVMSKARVAPTKVTTIPRLELSAAVVATRTGDLLKRELELDGIREYYWTDSKVVLGYINNDARRFHVFVANRVQQIRTSTETSQWRYVASEQNPADHASRGLTVKELMGSNWFTGPSFLWQRELPKDDIKVGEVNDGDPELKGAQVLMTKAREEWCLSDRLQRFSDWKRAVKAIARLKRCARSAKGLVERSNNSTTLEERKDAEQFIIHIVQEEVFSDEIKHLRQGKEVNSSLFNKLYKLSPFIDDHDVLRVGGRLTQAELHSHVKHPAILPKGHHISRLLIKHFHEKVQHQGRGMTINEIRSNGIWILGCSSEVSSLIYKCIKCRKLRKCNQEQRMADLPPERMEATPPFTYSGMDCFGPFYVKEGRKELKRYGLLFTCMCSRAVHLEVLDDLSTDAFLNALRCLIAIRGNVSQLYSDQGTNFVGAKGEFLKLMKGMDQERVKEFGCTFIMNPPASSHMGGVWERQIRTVRSVLTSILDKSAARLDSSSLRTFMYEVMAIVNSRPLTSEHLNDPVGPEPLTPNHILTMKSTIIAPPPGEFVREDLYLQKRWKRVQFLANEFWTRWRKEYLLNLQQRSKWNKSRRNTKINDIVLLQDDLASRNQWKLAKVVEVFPGSDGMVRRLKLLVSDATLDSKGARTNKSVYLERPIHKTVLLLEAD